MDLVDWFDPNNKEHLRTYVHVQNGGYWPMAALASKLADKYIEEKLRAIKIVDKVF